MSTTKTSTNSTQGATPMRTNTNHVLHVAVHDITEMVDAYYATTYTEALTKYDRAGTTGFIGFIAGNLDIRVTADPDKHGLWVSTFRSGVTVEHTFFAWPTNPTAVTIEQVAGHVLTLAREERNHDLRVDFYRQVTKQKPYVVAVRYAVAPTRRAQYIQSERRRRVNLTSRIDAARGFATEQEAQAWIDGIESQVSGLLLSVANRREWAVAGLAKLGEDAEPTTVKTNRTDSVAAMVEAFDRQPAHVVDRYLASLKDRA